MCLSMEAEQVASKIAFSHYVSRRFGMHWAWQDKAGLLGHKLLVTLAGQNDMVCVSSALISDDPERNLFRFVCRPAAH